MPSTVLWLEKTKQGYLTYIWNIKASSMAFWNRHGDFLSSVCNPSTFSKIYDINNDLLVIRCKYVMCYL